jgi:NADP-dependent 3-hydroxy acid dehydrogenase YdfG
LLKEKVAIVGGAIRFEISKEFPERGASAIVHSRGMASAKRPTNLIKRHTYPQRLDVTDAEAVAEFVWHVAEGHKHIDILINNPNYPFGWIIWNKKVCRIAEDLERVLDVVLEVAMEKWMKRRGSLREVTTIAASGNNRDFASVTTNMIVLDNGTVTL